jgi:O-antigen/teichoic acid export membrane protein
MLSNQVRKLLSGQLTRNVSWLGGAELVNRLFRLGTTITLARMFSPHDYGLMALIYTTYDFANVFTLKGGVSAKVIQADEQDVKAICDTSYWLNWILCLSVCIIQCITAFPIGYFSGNNQIILPLCTLALAYLMFPFFLVNSALIERDNRLKITALCNATQSFLSNAIIVILAIMGLGVWAIVWAMVLTTPVWIVITRMNHPWRPPKSITLEKWREIAGFGSSLLGIELLNKVRFNLDYLIIGSFLGVEALGAYYFAFNAGLGISMNFINTFATALFPYFCAARSDIKQLKQRFFSSLKKIHLIIIPLILSQASLAPLYVPVVFGEKWKPAIPILVILCLSALSLPVSYAVYHLLNAVGKTRINLYWSLTYTVIFGIFVLTAVQWGIFGVAISVLICRSVGLIFNIWAVKTTFIEN